MFFPFLSQPPVVLNTTIQTSGDDGRRRIRNRNLFASAFTEPLNVINGGTREINRRGEGGRIRSGISREKTDNLTEDSRRCILIAEELSQGKFSLVTRFYANDNCACSDEDPFWKLLFQLSALPMRSSMGIWTY